MTQGGETGTCLDKVHIGYSGRLMFSIGPVGVDRFYIKQTAIVNSNYLKIR